MSIAQLTRVKEADRSIVEAIRSGDPAAFRELYQLHFRRIHNFSLRRLGDPAEAEDVCQEVFEAVYSCLDRFEGKSDLVVWIYGITRNILNNRLRRRGCDTKTLALPPYCRRALGCVSGAQDARSVREDS